MQLINITKLNKKYKLDFNNDKTLYVSENTVIKFGLVKKIEISAETFKKIIENENKEKAFSLGLNYLSYGLRTEYEVAEYLRKKEIAEEQIAYAMAKLVEYNYLNDRRYAELAVRDYFNLKKKGPSWITRKLEEKQVAREYIEEYLAETCTREQMIDTVYSLIEKEFTKKNEAKNKKIQKITTKLYTNGYSFDIINTVFKIFLEEHVEEDEDKNVIAKYYDKAYSRLSRKYDDKYTLKQKIIEKLMRDGFSYGDIKDYLQEIDF